MTESQAIIVCDLGFGDAGKGSMVDFLTREYGAHTVVRYNGGAQAAHNVVTADGRHHTFAQFGSGSFVPGVRTHLSRYMLVNPFNLFAEGNHLVELGVTDAFSRVTIDEGALIITPFQVAANRLREMSRGMGIHGSCGQGIGETMADYLHYGERVVFARDLQDSKRLAKKLRFLRDCKRAEISALRKELPATEEAKRELRVFEDPGIIAACLEIYQDFIDLVRVVADDYLGQLLAEPGTVVFEGAQGVLLDEWFGFHPYTTWSTTTFENAETLLAEHGYSGLVTKLGLLRAYSTRHGPGPFVTEDEYLTREIPDQHNGNNPWQREFRVGYFDMPMTKYALEVCNGVDSLAITNLDRLAPVKSWDICRSYRYHGAINDLDGYFEVCANRARTIKVGQKNDLKRQEKLGQLLGQMRPDNFGMGLDRSDQRRAENFYLGVLESTLGVPVGIASSGPTADDKRTFKSWEKRVGNR